MPKLTETFALKACKIDTETQTRYWDDLIPGFGLFCGKKSKAWYYQREVAGRTTRVRIGPFPTINARAARETAQELALQHARGRGKAAMRTAPTLQEAMVEYLARPKLRSASNTKSVRGQIEKHLGDWLRKPLDEIDRRMVVARHAKLRDRPSAANHLMQDLRTIWNHARRTHDLPESPTVAIEWFDEGGQGEVITDYAAWAKQVDALGNPIHRVYYRLLLTTGLRRSECASLSWANVHPGHLHLPMTKNGRPFDLPLTEVHHAILAPVRGLDREWVFPAWRGKTGHLVAAEPIDWTFHAHRRTFATIAQHEAGLFEETVGRLLNHTPKTVTGARYVVTDYQRLAAPMQQVVEAMARLVPGLKAEGL